MNYNKNIEVMAPVGSYESLAAAIKAGCNSVYFGIEQLNMRARSSNNFTTEDLAKIATIYIGVGQYGSFRQGIREIAQDVNNISGYVIDNFENEPQIGDERIIRYEKRTGLTGRINNIYRSIDKLERRLNILSQQEMRNELNSIKQEISNILILLPDNTQQQFLEELPVNCQNNLPEPNERRVNYLISRYAMKPDEEIEFIEE